MTSYALAIDVGGTKVQAALVDEHGTVLEGSVHRAPTGSGASSGELLASVAQVIWNTLSALPDGAELIGAGIGSAGPIDYHRGTISPLNLPAWQDFPLREQVAELVPRLIGVEVPVQLALDGLAIAMAEQWIGSATQARNILGMVVSTGIGGGLILDGRPILGRNGNAGHIGHVEVAGIGGSDSHGSTTTLESIASGPNSAAWARSQSWIGEGGEDLAKSLREGDPIAIAAVQRSGQAIGQAIAATCALLDLEIVAIGGGFAGVGPELLERIRTVVAGHHFPYVRDVTIVESSAGEHAPLVGAAALVYRSDLLPTA